MKKYIISIIVSIILICGGVWLFLNFQKNDKDRQSAKNTNESNYQAERSSSTNSNNTSNRINITKKETEIASFSTKIYSKETGRQNNISITCKSIDSKSVAPGEVFSFCETVGKSTVEKGYQEADIYVDGEKKKGLGGGNCQVSTTLYNAILKVQGLNVLERHKHSGHVPYIAQDKDAAVSYGTYDFKFKNNTKDVIKIEMKNTADNITAKIIKIEEGI